MELNESSARSLTEMEKLFVINDLSIINLKFFGVLHSGKLHQQVRNAKWTSLFWTNRSVKKIDRKFALTLRY